MRGKKLLAAAAAAAAVTIGGAGTAFGAPAVTPNSNLTNNQSVTVTWDGFNPNEIVFISQCWLPEADPNFDPNTTCSPTNGINPNSGADGTGSAPYVVWTGLDPNIGEQACAATPVPGAVQTNSTCYIRLSPGSFGATARDVTLPITFAAAGTNVPEAPYAVLLPLGALTVLGGAYFVMRNRKSTQAAA